MWNLVRRTTDPRWCWVAHYLGQRISMVKFWNFGWGQFPWESWWVSPFWVQRSFKCQFLKLWWWDPFPWGSWWKSRFVGQRSSRGQISNLGDGIRFMYLWIMEANIFGISCEPEVIFTNFRGGVSFHTNDDEVSIWGRKPFRGQILKLGL